LLLQSSPLFNYGADQHKMAVKLLCMF